MELEWGAAKLVDAQPRLSFLLSPGSVGRLYTDDQLPLTRQGEGWGFLADPPLGLMESYH